MRIDSGRLRTVVLSGALMLSAVPANATVGVLPGQPAPPLVASRWPRGEPVERFAPGIVYAIDFWSTWCKPCIVAMPQIHALQEKYADSLVVIAMDIWEMNPANVPDFVSAHRDEMPSIVAMDSIPPDKEADLGLTVSAYLGTSGLFGIPRICLVGKDGRVAWIGPPEGIEDVLADVMKGTWDVPAFAKVYEQWIAEEQALQETFVQVDEAIAQSDWSAAIRLCETSAVAQPRTASQVARRGFIRMATKMLSGSPDAMQTEVALRAMDRGLELFDPPDWQLYVRCAEVVKSAGRSSKSVEYLRQALKYAPLEEKAGIEMEVKTLGGE